VFECNEDGNGCATVSTTTLAMAPIDPCRLARSDKTDRATQAATFELVGRAAHNLMLHIVLELVVRRKSDAAVSEL
jgi:hypothetical protein